MAEATTATATAATSTSGVLTVEAPARLPRVTIQFCTQCKWMLRAAYFAQELLSTFSASLGEVALQPATGGIFTVTITHLPPSQPTDQQPAGPNGRQPSIQSAVLWDRKTEGGFPETKELKRRVRDVIQPGRDLGHVDRRHGAAGTETRSAELGLGLATDRHDQQQELNQPLETPKEPSRVLLERSGALKGQPDSLAALAVGDVGPGSNAVATSGLAQRQKGSSAEGDESKDPAATTLASACLPGQEGQCEDCE